MFNSNQTSWGAVDMLASDRYEKLCPLKLVHPNFEKLGDLYQLFLKVKAMFCSRGKFQAYYC